MGVYPKNFEASVESLKKFPGVGEKSAERMRPRFLRALRRDHDHPESGRFFRH